MALDGHAQQCSVRLEHVRTVSSRRKALCIGINYHGTCAELQGSVNDALHWLAFLTQHSSFHPDDVLVMIDEFPSGEAVRESDPSGYWRPTKELIIEALGWFVQDAAPGDVLFFSFSGHCVRVSEGLVCGGPSDALCPVDWDGFDSGVMPHRLVDLSTLQKHFAHLPGGVCLTVVLDTSIVGVCPFQLPFRIDCLCPARELQRDHALQSGAPRDGSCDVWLHQCVSALPRRLPLEAQKPLWSPLGRCWSMRKPTEELNEGLAVFCFVACHGKQTALELSLDGFPQGCLSYCALRALEAVTSECTYAELCQSMGAILQRLRLEVAMCMDQCFQLSYGKNAAPNCLVLHTSSALVAKDRARRRRGQVQRPS
mmetsp:Transcript_47199/g.109154  ORF Transcript_47199/g.109154 Transcript_47199/m.109154 type:complete len:369 (+) Transcript_47199:77-1183(+)